MKNIQFIALFAILFLAVNAVQLRKETAKEQVHLVTAEIAEPIHYENQYHSGQDITPEIVYAPVEFRFKETEQTNAQVELSVGETSLGRLAPGVHYNTVETIQTEPESENGYFSPEIVGARFMEVDKVTKSFEERHKKHHQEEGDEPEDTTDNVEQPQSDSQAKAINQAKVESTTQAKVESNIQAKTAAKIQSHADINGLTHPPEYDGVNFEPVKKVAHISDYSQEDLARIAAGGVRVFPITRPVEDTYGDSPQIFHHIIDSATTDIDTAKSPLTETKKVLWRDFTPPSAGFTDVNFKNDLGFQDLPDVMKDERGQPRDYWANILNYPTPVNVGQVVPSFKDDQDLTNVANSIKSREFTSTYDHAQVPNPVE